MTKHAEEVDKDWYHQRPEPNDSRMVPFWKRESDLVLKLAMVLSLCDDMSLVIDVDHVVKAHDLVREAREAVPLIIQWATQSTMTQQERIIEQFLKQRKRRWVRRSRLYETMSQFNMSGKQMLELVENLEMRGVVVSRKAGNSAEYRYVEQKNLVRFG